MSTNTSQPDEAAWYLGWSSLFWVVIAVLVTLCRLIWNIVPIPIASYSLLAVCGIWFVVGSNEVRRRLHKDYGLSRPAHSTLAREAVRGLPPPWPLATAIVGGFCLLVVFVFLFTTENIVEKDGHYIVKHHPERVRTEGQVEVAGNDTRITILNVLTIGLLSNGVALLSIHRGTYGQTRTAR